MAITAALVRELREKSGAGMMECKKALEATSGDIEQAFDHLRKAGLKSAAKKAGREMAEGIVDAKISEDGGSGAMVALTTETDFVIKSEHVVDLMGKLVSHAVSNAPADAEAMLGQSWADGGTVDDAVKSVIGKAGENMSVAKAAHLQNGAGKVGAYVHHNGRVGVLASITTGADAEKANAFLKTLGMHVAALKPVCLNRDEVPADAVERETAIFRAEVENKPAEIQDKIISGKLEKFYSGIVLNEQPWVMDDKKSVEKALKDELGADSKIEAYHLFQIGV